MILTDKVNLEVNEKSHRYFTGIEEFLVNFIVPIVVVVISIGLFVLYILPTAKKLPVLKEQIGAKTQELVVLQAKVDQLSYLQQNKNLVIQDLVKMSWALEERDKVPELTEQVRVMSKDSAVAFVSLNYDNANKGELSAVAAPSTSLTPDPELYREEKVNVTVGINSVSSIVSFLRTTENSIRLFKVESLRISTREQGNTAALVMASPYLNPAFSTYSETSAPINLTDSAYRGFMERLDTFKNYAQTIDATLPRI